MRDSVETAPPTVKAAFESARELRVLVVGETIVDEYLYCETLGKSGKEPILAARYLSEERFAGGALAVANQIAELSNHVTVLSFVGGRESHEDFIRSQMSSKVELRFITIPNAPTILKRRYVEHYPLQKLFELYLIDSDAYVEHSDALCSELAALLPDSDVVVVTDYGHGMIGPEAVAILCRGSRFLAVNTQMNADNRGFNTISKYTRADFVSVSETELRLEARRRHGDLHEIVVEVAERMGQPQLLVTRGGKGVLCYDRTGGLAEIPAFTPTIVDRVGAGDAVLAITSLCAAQGIAGRNLGVVANAVGAQAVGIVGNKRVVDMQLVLREVVEHVAA